MIALASGLCVYLASGVTDMRKGLPGLAMLVQQTLAEDPSAVPCSPSATDAPG